MPTFEIYESNPIITNAFNVTINLRNGDVQARQVITQTEQLVSKLPQSVKSQFVFPSTDTGEGLIQVWYIVLENGNSYFYSMGTAHSTPVGAGGNAGDIKRQDINYRPIEKHLRGKVKAWQAMYSQNETVKIIKELNTLLGDVINELN